MTRLLPRTLFAQTLLLLLGGIGLALAAGAWIYASARQEAVRAVGALAAAERIVNVSRLLGDVPSEWRERIVTGASDAAFRVALQVRRPVLAADGSETQAGEVIAGFLRQALPRQQVLVVVRSAEAEALSGTAGPPIRGPGYGPGPGFRGGMGPGTMMPGQMMHGPMQYGPLARGAMSWRDLQAAVELADGKWLSFATTLPDTGPTTSPRLFVALAVVAGLIAALTAWAVRRLTAPLRVLSQAALAFGQNVDAPPVAVAGSLEMRRAAGAFNEMQLRLRRMIENRTLMLAAISHDLRTQLTLLKLRAEGGEGPDDHQRLVKTIGEMEEMLTATLSFARDEAASEARKRVDLSALVASIVDDMADAGLKVSEAGVARGIVAELKTMALRRAITNLLDNAVKYGGGARIGLSDGDGEITVTVDDDGPGIPEAQLGEVLQPFHRLETSRNRETGGIGLGLAIAASVAAAHGGELVLANRPEGGLRATLRLPDR